MSQKNYARIAAALPRLATAEDDDNNANWRAAAAAANMRPAYFCRVFKRHVGVSPKQYAACHKLANMQERLAAGESVLQAALAAGMSGGARAHDLFVAYDGMTPGEYARSCAGVCIDYGVAESVFGRVFVAATARGICLLHFAPTPAAAAAARAALARRWQNAVLRPNNARARRLAADVFANNGDASPLHVRGTNFQINVWRALLALPAGEVVSYRALARAAGGSPKGARAAATAVAANPVAALIPCHRVVAACGAPCGYAWGTNIKRALLARERALKVCH